MTKELTVSLTIGGEEKYFATGVIDRYIGHIYDNRIDWVIRGGNGEIRPRVEQEPLTPRETRRRLLELAKECFPDQTPNIEIKVENLN